MESEKVTALITQLNGLLVKLSDEDQRARLEALQLSQKLTASLEQPENVAVNLVLSPLLSIAARVAVNLGLFRLVVNHDDGITSKELASLSGAEELLIIRILRPLVSIGLLDEAGERTWKATAVTKAMAKEEIAAGHRMADMIVGAAQKVPKYLQEAGYRCPVDPNDGFMQYAFQTKLSTFQFFSSMPNVLKDFNLFMGNTMGAREYWVDWFPIEERLLEGADFADQPALLVDVGGGKGHDLLEFHARFPQEKGRLVLQDISPVVDSIENRDASLEYIAYDFFTEQPVKGARAYLYHHILHDWPDDTCLEILDIIKTAMKPGYSKLLIHELIVPEQGAATFHAMYDMVMMAFNAGMERTERQWRGLLEKAGLVVVKVWLPSQDGADGVVEVMLPE